MKISRLRHNPLLFATYENKQWVPCFQTFSQVFFSFKIDSVYILKSWSIMFPLESPLAALLNLDIGKSSLRRDVWSDGDTRSDLLGQPGHWSLCMLGPRTASSLLTDISHRDRRPQTAVSSVFNTVPVHITDVGSPFPGTHAYNWGNCLLERCVRHSAVW